jgi:anti-sigma-K factor RskA
MTMKCEEIEDLAGAYALGALPEDERADVSAHLESCDKHPEMGELQMAAASLALAAPEIDPPPALKSRLMDAIRAESPRQRAPISSAPRRSLGETIRGWFSSPRLGYGLASAMAVLVLGLVAWNVSLQGGDSDRTVMNVTGDATGRIIYLQDDKIAVMDVRGLDPLPAGKVYEVWAITGNSATPLGILQVDDEGTTVTSMSFDANGVEQIGVTVEDAPGVDAPTSAPVFTAQFS